MEDDFQVALLDDTGTPLPTVMDGLARCAVGEPGESFRVEVSCVNVTGCDYRVSVKIDGQSVGYSLIFNGSRHNYRGVFEGWLDTNGAADASGATVYRAFVFGKCSPGADAATVDDVKDIQAGVVEVTCEHVIATGVDYGPLTLRSTGPDSSADSKKLPEGKKWFLAPGLSTKAGGVRSAITSWNRTTYSTIKTLPPLMLRYDCSESLMLRKVLNPRTAAHRALLARSANPGVRALGTPSHEASSSRRGAGAAGAAGRGGASSSRGIKREGGQHARVKRERQEGGGDEEEDDFVPPRSASAPTVDLTEEPARPLMLGGRALRNDEVALCDLCDSDDDKGGGGGKWEVRKKQALDVQALDVDADTAG